jgi:opacity protein-like surface antigen
MAALDGAYIGAGVSVSKYSVEDRDGEKEKENNNPISLFGGATLSKFDGGALRGEVSLFSKEKYRESYDYSWISWDQGCETTASLFGNLFVDFDVSPMFKPFIGVGLGFAKNKLSVYMKATDMDFADRYYDIDKAYGSESGDDISLAYKFSLGVNLLAGQNFRFGIGWEYRNYGSLKTDYKYTLEDSQFSGGKLVETGTDKYGITSSGLIVNLAYLF